MVRGSEGRGRVGSLGVGLLAVSVTLVAANSPPRFLLETSVGSEIVLRLREGPQQQNNSILRSVHCLTSSRGKSQLGYFLVTYFDLLTLTQSGLTLDSFPDRGNFC